MREINDAIRQSVYVRPRRTIHPYVVMGLGPVWFRPITVECGHCGRTVTRFAWFGRVKCDCGSINCPTWTNC